MGRPRADIDRLIDEGLTRYGRGDLEGALASWEQVLDLDPQHEQALGYIDYVRMNYELLANEVGGQGEVPPFPIADEGPGYRIEAAQGELAAGSAVLHYGAALDGWAIEEEEPGHGRLTVNRLTLELDSSEPELELEPFHVPGPPDTTEPSGLSFEDATKEYDTGSRFEPEATPGFGGPGDATPLGFATQLTELRPRDLGFVQPVAPQAPVAPHPPVAADALDDPPTIERSPLHPATADLLATLRAQRSTPREVREVKEAKEGKPREPAGDARQPAPADAPVARNISPPRARASSPAAPVPPPPTRAPTPLPMAVVDLSARDPHEFDAPTERKDGRAPTSGNLASAVGSARQGFGNPALVSAPTRDLGLRPGPAAPRPESEPVGPAEAGGPHRAPVVPVSSTTTHNDLVLPFDPIDARSAQILDAIDRRSPAPPDEPREDRTRRRIAALFEHAMEWSREGELDRAVTAVDLALSEDPDSALTQKLIHRNRDTIMNVFQAFLGDLHRTPVLARPLHELAASPISPRAAFLLSRVDGLLSLDEILDVSGMPRMEAYRYLCQLFLRGILR